MIDMIKRWLGFRRGPSDTDPDVAEARRQDDRDQAALAEVRTQIALITNNRQAITQPIPVYRHDEDGSPHEYR